MMMMMNKRVERIATYTCPDKEYNSGEAHPHLHRHGYALFRNPNAISEANGDLNLRFSGEGSKNEREGGRGRGGGEIGSLEAKSSSCG